MLFKKLTYVMLDLENSPTWKEFILAMKMLPNNKTPGLNNVQPNSFNTIHIKNLRHHFNFIWNSEKEQLISLNGTKARWFQFLKVETYLNIISGEE